MKTWALIAEAVERHGRCAMVTVADVQGSAPREVGARMIVMPDGGFRGTIGGGALEWRALAEAQAMLGQAAPEASLRRHALGPELGQCCGGSIRLLIEVFDRSALQQVAELAAREVVGAFATHGHMAGAALDRTVMEPPGEPAPAIAVEPTGTVTEIFSRDTRPLYLFGAGHVGRAVVLALAPLPFEVTWIDPRRESFPAAMPGNVRAVHLPDPASAFAAAPARAFVLVMTHSHALDLELVHAALAAERFGYVGLIGSATKRARFRSRLTASGLSQAALSQLVCPVGLPGIRSKAPAAIAASLAADLLMRDEAEKHCKEPVAVFAKRA